MVLFSIIYSVKRQNNKLYGADAKYNALLKVIVVVQAYMLKRPTLQCFIQTP